MNSILQNKKTTIAGIGAIGIGIFTAIHAWAVGNPIDTTTLISSITLGLGLIFARDHNALPIFLLSTLSILLSIPGCASVIPQQDRQYARQGTCTLNIYVQTTHVPTTQPAYPDKLADTISGNTNSITVNTTITSAGGGSTDSHSTPTTSTPTTTVSPTVSVPAAAIP